MWLPHPRWKDTNATMNLIEMAEAKVGNFTSFLLHVPSLWQFDNPAPHGWLNPLRNEFDTPAQFWSLWYEHSMARPHARYTAINMPLENLLCNPSMNSGYSTHNSYLLWKYNVSSDFCASGDVSSKRSKDVLLSDARKQSPGCCRLEVARKRNELSGLPASWTSVDWAAIVNRSLATGNDVPHQIDGNWHYACYLDKLYTCPTCPRPATRLDVTAQIVNRRCPPPALLKTSASQTSCWNAVESYFTSASYLSWTPLTDGTCRDVGNTLLFRQLLDQRVWWRRQDFWQGDA